MRTVFSRLLEKYGEDALLFDGDGEVQIRAFIQPTAGNTPPGTKTVTPLGKKDNARFMCFIPAGVEISDPERAFIEASGKRYGFIKAKAYRVEGRLSHWEAVLEVREEEYDV